MLSIFFTIVSTVQEQPAWIPSSWDISQLMVELHPRYQRVIYKPANRQLTIGAMLESYPAKIIDSSTDASLTSRETPYAVSTPGSEQGHSYSGFPIGSSRYQRNGSGKISNSKKSVGISLTCASGIRLTITYTISSRIVQIPEDGLVIERYAREILNNNMVSDMIPSESSALFGSQIKTYTFKPTGTKFVSVKALAQAKGFQITWNATDYRAQVTSSQGSLIIPLASAEVKLKNNWRRTCLPAALVNNELFIPINDVQKLFSPLG